METFYLLLCLSILYSTYKTLLYPFLLSPLRRIPAAHPLCKWTSAWFKYRRTHSQELRTLYSAHQKYGPIVQLGPSEVSIVSQEGLQKVYSAGLDKDLWYLEIMSNYNGIPNLVCTVQHSNHAAQKRKIAGLYIKSYVHQSRNLEIVCKRTVFDYLLPQLRQLASGQNDVDVVSIFEAVSVDTITGYLFGPKHGTNFVQDMAARERYFGAWNKLRSNSRLKPELQIIEETCMDMCRGSLISRETDRDGEQTLFLRLYDHLVAPDKAENETAVDQAILMECASEMLDHIIATQETNTTTWTYILYQLSQHPLRQRQLRAELEDCAERHAHDGGHFSPAVLDSLPFLDAVLQETLRLHAGNPARLPRVVPQGGITLEGHFIPNGTTVSSNAYCLHRNERLFPQPEEWIPERWLQTPGESPGAKQSRVDEMRKWFWAFGSGPRGCIGRHFAVLGESSWSPSPIQSDSICSYQACGCCNLQRVYHFDCG
jgi:cytochrome P450